MTERLLQYIWQYQYFNNSNLQTHDGQPLQVLQPGMLNSNQGPDFLNAKIRIDATTWAGSVEVHVHASEWNEHGHSNDPNYNNVILHVVWNNDMAPILPFPALELNQRVSKILLQQYDSLMQDRQFIPCESHISKIDSFTILAWKERLMVERLQQKIAFIDKLLQQNSFHWEETFWWMLAKNFGSTINGTAFEKMAQSIPLKIISKHKQQIQQLEALLLGQAGLLEKEFTESYPKMLQKEYRFLKKKYGLRPIHEPVHFLRMRPANFPGIRLAQLAMLIQQSTHLFSSMKDAPDCGHAEQLLQVTANDYWHYHYIFDEATAYKKKTLGKQMTGNIMINTVIPMIYAYGHFNKIDTFKEKALAWMPNLETENNSITRNFEKLGVENKNAFDSQALVQLKNEYCNQVLCLKCAIGNKILGKDTAK